MGRTGAAGLPFVDVVEGEAWMNVFESEEVEDVGGHSVAPHARPVGQQPPPREAGHELKPLEQVRELCGLTEADGEGMGTTTKEEVEGESEDDGGGLEVEVEADVDVEVEEVEVEEVEEGGEAVTVGVMMTVSVELLAPENEALVSFGHWRFVTGRLTANIHA